ncbi:hypothetical protein IWX47DRAFT_277058 [Phyllosticta citricarpa]|uniref:Uncharacterized protein n=1 Tax=Phyllosticta citricarpa TaxID=55181 RepID=A0ABR1M461_9PEZI
MSAARDTGHAVGTEGRGWGGAAKEAMERRRRARSQTLRAIHRTMRCHGAAERPTSSDHSPVAAARDIPTTELGPGRGMSETNFFFKFFFFFYFSLSLFSLAFSRRHLARPLSGRRPSLRSSDLAFCGPPPSLHCSHDTALVVRLALALALALAFRLTRSLA